jgi:hypothetical protein
MAVNYCGICFITLAPDDLMLKGKMSIKEKSFGQKSQGFVSTSIINELKSSHSTSTCNASRQNVI